MHDWIQSYSLPASQQAAVQTQIARNPYSTGFSQQYQDSYNSTWSNPANAYDDPRRAAYAAQQVAGQMARPDADTVWRNSAAHQQGLAREAELKAQRQASTYMGMPGIQTGYVNGEEVAFGPGLARVGIADTTPTSAVRDTFIKGLQQADSKALQALAAAGNPLAAQAIPAAVARETAAAKQIADDAAARTQELYNTRYVTPAQIKAKTDAINAAVKEYLGTINPKSQSAGQQAAAVKAWGQHNTNLVKAGEEPISYNQWATLYGPPKSDAAGAPAEPGAPGIVSNMMSALGLNQPTSAPALPKTALPAQPAQPAVSPQTTAAAAALPAGTPQWVAAKFAGLPAADQAAYASAPPEQQQQFLSWLAGGGR